LELRLSLALNESVLAQPFTLIVAIHWLEANAENRALQHLVPVMQHFRILQRASNFLCAPGDHLTLVLGNCRCLVVLPSDKIIQTLQQI
jgi:hypothetical protein